MTPVNDVVERIVQVLTDEGARPARVIFERLIGEGVSDETASRAIASGSHRGAFNFDSSLRLSLPSKR